MIDAAADSVSALMGLLQERWVFALASAATADGLPYATPLYFALLDDASPALIFVSDPSTAHAQHIATGPTNVAGCVFAEHTEVAQLRGVQFRGLCLREVALPDELVSRARAAYLSRHPVAAPVLARTDAALYLLAVTWAKLTDNRVAFGHKQTISFDPPAWATGA